LSLDACSPCVLRFEREINIINWIFCLHGLLREFENRELLYKQRVIVQTESYCANRELLCKQRVIVQTESYCTNRELLCKQRVIVQTESYCTNTHYRFLHHEYLFMFCCSVFYTRWCRHRDCMLSSDISLLTSLLRTDATFTSCEAVRKESRSWNQQKMLKL